MIADTPAGRFALDMLRDCEIDKARPDVRIYPVQEPGGGAWGVMYHAEHHAHFMGTVADRDQAFDVARIVARVLGAECRLPPAAVVLPFPAPAGAGVTRPGDAGQQPSELF